MYINTKVYYTIYSIKYIVYRYLNVNLKLNNTNISIPYLISYIEL